MRSRHLRDLAMRNAKGKPSLNPINPAKLLNSKWTAKTPRSREKHFVVTELELDEAGRVVECVLEAVISKRAEPIDWRELRDPSHWQQGWK